MLAMETQEKDVNTIKVKNIVLTSNVVLMRFNVVLETPNMVLVSSLLLLNIFKHFSRISIVNFEE